MLNQYIKPVLNIYLLNDSMSDIICESTDGDGSTSGTDTVQTSSDAWTTQLGGNQ